MMELWLHRFTEVEEDGIRLEDGQKEEANLEVEDKIFNQKDNAR
jgi:hypothetical protein